MSNDWKEVTLGDLFKVKHGFAFKGEFFTDDVTETVCVTPGNFAIGGGFQNPKPKYYNGPVPEDYILTPGKIVVTMTDLSKASDTLGLAAIIPDDKYTWLHNQRVGLLEFKDEVKTDPKFINYFLRSHGYRSWVVGSATGTTVKHTSPSRIESYSCRIPSYKEQVLIADFLGTIDNKIELNRKTNTTLESMAQALFKSWFVDFDPVIDNALAAGNAIPNELQARAEKRQAFHTAQTANGDETSLPAEIQQLFPSSFVFTEEMGWVPEGWGCKPVYDMAKFINGAAFKAANFSSGNEGLPVIKIAELKNGISGQTKFTDSDFDQKYRIDNRDILFSWSGNPDTSIDTFIWMNGTGWLNQHIFRVSLHSPDDYEYVYSMLKLLKPIFAEIARDKQTTGLGHVTAGDMKRLFVVDPVRDVRDAFHRHAGSLISRRNSADLEIKNLIQARDTLLPKLLSGKLQIPDAEQQVAEVL